MHRANAFHLQIFEIWNVVEGIHFIVAQTDKIFHDNAEKETPS